MGKTEGSNAGPFSWIKSIKLKKTQHLDFTINENGFVKRINTIFFSRVPTNNGDKKKKTPSDYRWMPLGECTGGLGCPVHTATKPIIKQETYQ
jgi:hypothetical protein